MPSVGFMTDKERLEFYFSRTKTDENGCMNYVYQTRARPEAQYNKQQTTLARIVYRLVHGYEPKGLEVAHNCMNPKCINPDHLEAKTHSENQLDEYKADIGSSQALSVDAIKDIKNCLKKGHQQTTLARKYGVSKGMINRIANNQTWKWIC